MKKLNKKGFILVETLIVTVFVVSLFIIIYKATVPALGELEQQNKYDDIDSVYYSNLYKQMLTRYGNVPILDTYLQTATYVDISDCDGKIGEDYIYTNRDYCKLLQENLDINENDRIILTDYNIGKKKTVGAEEKSFRDEVSSNAKFDSGSLTNFRDYINTVSNEERFYSKKKLDSELSGKYRLFIIREITETDSSTTMRYANIGIYAGNNEKYIQGELVYYKVNNSTELPFYVLKNSPTTSSTVTLISANNIISAGTPYFNCTGKFVVPDQEHSPLVPAFRTGLYDITLKSYTDANANKLMDNNCSSTSTLNIIRGQIGVLNPSTVTGKHEDPSALEYAPNSIDNTNTLLLQLRNATSNWTNTNKITTPYINYVIKRNDNGEIVKDTDGNIIYEKEYIINYGKDENNNNKSDYARLLTSDDIFEIMGCREDNTACFDKNTAQSINLNPDITSWLYNGLTGEAGYWTGSSVPGSNLYAWSIVEGRVVPTKIDEHANMGVRPVIEVNKDSNLRRG